ncbi:unnamed protein product, partial [Aphanomyces euteiches]
MDQVADDSAQEREYFVDEASSGGSSDEASSSSDDYDDFDGEIVTTLLTIARSRHRSISPGYSGSIKGRRYIERCREDGDASIIRDYLAPYP